MDPSDILSRVLQKVQSAADPRLSLRPFLGALDAPTHLLAFGKASLEMADEFLRVKGPLPGVVVCVPDRLDALAPDRAAAFGAAGIALLPADHPLATERNLEAAAAVRDLVASLAPADHLLVLISGGGSAHLTLPTPGVTLADLREVTLAIQRAGLSIAQLNAVRKHCEQLKGGRLAAMCPAERITCLVLSDVLGDPPDVISSGPFAPDPSTYADGLAVLHAAGAPNQRILDHLQQGARSQHIETPKPGSPVFARVRSTVIAGNSDIVAAAAGVVSAEGFALAPVRTLVHGEARELALRWAPDIRAAAGGTAFIFGGEWTVNASGSTGSGGPSQELALALACELAGTPFHALCYSTDGIDGPTDAAGAIVTGRTLADVEARGMIVRDFLSNHDSHTLLDRLGALIRTGPTGTNLNHIAVVLCGA